MKKMLQNQTTIFIVVGVIIVIVIAVIIYFVMKNKDNYDNYENFNMIENYEEHETEDIENYLINDYALKYVENFELLNLKNTKFNPILKDHMNRIIHFADLINREENLEIIKREARRIGLNKKLIDRVLANQQTVKKFVVNVHTELNNKHNTIGKILKTVAPEHLEEIKDQLPNKVEKFTENYELEKGFQLFSKRIRKQDNNISKFKKILHDKSLNNTTRLTYDPEVMELAIKANVNKDALNKILSCLNETKKFIENITTLEHYDPLNYIENYSWGSFWHSVSSPFVAAANTVARVATQAESGIVQAANTVAHVATNVGNEIKNHVVSVIKDVAAGATVAFNSVKAGVMIGIEEIKKGIMYLINLLGDIWQKVKDLMIKGANMLINFVKSEIQQIISRFFRVNDGCPSENKQLPCHTYQINSTKIHDFLLHKFENIVLDELLPEIIVLEKIPIVGKYVQEAIDKLMNPIFDLAYNPLQGVINGLINTIIHKMAPNSNNIVIQFVEWFSVEDYVYDVKDIKDNIKDNIKKVKILQKNSPIKCDHQCTLLSNTQKSHISCLESCIKTIPQIHENKREHITFILQKVVKTEYKEHIGKIVNELLLIVKDK